MTSYMRRKALSWEPRTVGSRYLRHAEKLEELIASGKADVKMLPVAQALRKTSRLARNVAESGEPQVGKAERWFG